jgi:hypothetical protein
MVNKKTLTLFPVIDLSTFPQVVYICFFGDSNELMCIDEEGGLLLLMKSENHCSSRFSLLSQIMDHDGKMDSDNSVYYFKKPGHRLIQILQAWSSNHSNVYLFQASDGVLVKLQSNNSGIRTYFLKGFSARYAQLVVLLDGVAILTECNRVFFANLRHLMSSVSFDPEYSSCASMSWGFINISDILKIVSFEKDLLMMVRNTDGKVEAKMLAKECRKEFEGISADSDFCFQTVIEANHMPSTNSMCVHHRQAAREDLEDSNMNAGLNYPVCYYYDPSDAKLKVLPGQNFDSIKPLDNTGKPIDNCLVMLIQYPSAVSVQDPSNPRNLLSTYSQTEMTDDAQKIKTYQWLENGKKVLSSSNQMPDISERLQVCIKLIGPKYSRAGLAKFTQGLLTSLTYFSSELKLMFLPNFFEMDDDEFEEFKKQTTEIWMDRLTEIKTEHARLPGMMLSLQARKLDDESYERAQCHKIYETTYSLPLSNEYKQFTQTTPLDFSVEVLESVFNSQKVTNHGFFRYWSARPVFQNVLLAAEDKRKMGLNLWNSFEYNLNRRVDGEDYLSYQLNRMRAMKHTTLKRQNFSLLNLLTFEMNSVSEGNFMICRTFFESAELNFTGEGSRILTSSWHRCRWPSKRIPRLSEQGVGGEAQVVHQIT